MDLPPTSIVPEVGSSKPAIPRNNVVFPDPEGPTTTTHSPRSTSRLTSHKSARADASANSFEAVAREWFTKMLPTWSPDHADKIIKRFERDVFPWIGGKPVDAMPPHRRSVGMVFQKLALFPHMTAAEIIGINAGSFKLQSIFKTGLPDYKKDFSYNPKLSDNIIGGKVAMIVNKRIYTWDLKKGELLFQSPVYPDISYFLLRQINEHEILFYTYNPKGTLQVINTVTSQKRQIHRKRFGHQ